MKAILLVRVSTYLQDTDPQKQRLIDYATQKGYTELYIIETVESGLASTEDKIGMNALFAKIQEDDEYKTVICSELSRISRRQSILHAFKERMISERIQLIVLNGFELLNERGEESHTANVYFAIYGAISEEEIKITKERSRTARKRYVSEGLSIPGKQLFGYKRVYDPVKKKNVFVIDEAESNLVREIYNWYLYGLPNGGNNSVSTKMIAQYCIAKNFHKYTKSKRNVNKLLKEIAYTGSKVFKFRNGDNSISNVNVPYPEIISKSLFDEVQQKMQTANTNVDKSQKCTILAKKIVCNQCATKLTANYSIIGKVDKSTYRCGRRSSAKSCANRTSVQMRMIDSAVWSLLKSNQDFIDDLIKNETKDAKTKIPTIENEIAHYSSRIENNKVAVKTIKEMLTNWLNRPGSIDDTMISELKDFKNKENNLYQLIKNDEEVILRKKSELAQLKKYISTNEFRKQSMNELENDREVLKKHVDMLIKEIQIVYHTREISAFTIIFKGPFFGVGGAHIGMDYHELQLLDFPVTIVIEKHDNNRKRLFWYEGYCIIDYDHFIFCNEIVEKGEIQPYSRAVKISEVKNWPDDIDEDEPEDGIPDYLNVEGKFKEIKYDMLVVNNRGHNES